MKYQLSLIKNSISTTIKSSLYSSIKIAALPIFMTVIAVTANAQNGGTAAQKLIDGTTTKTTKTTTKKTPVQPKPPKPPKPKKPIVTTGNAGGRPPRDRGDDVLAKVDKLTKVTISTAASDVEIWIDGKQAATSDKTGKAKLIASNGQHQLFAKKGEKTLLSPTLITVSPTQFIFDYSADISKSMEGLYKDEIDAINKANQQTPSQSQVDVKSILLTYRDPQKSETVTLNDWQNVYRQASEQMTKGSTSNEVESLVAFARGQIELASGANVNAVNAFSSATVFTPSSALAYYGLGLAHLASNNMNEATNAFTKSVQIDREFALPYERLGDIYSSQNKNKEAVTYFEQAKTQGLTSNKLRLKIAEIQIKNKNCKAAVKELEVLEKEAPNAGVYSALSDCYVEQKRAVSAIEVLNKAITLEPNQPLSYQKVGLIYLKQKEFGKAQESFERALALDVEANKLDHKELQDLIEKARKKAR